MSKKNLDLCERSFCRQRYTKVVYGYTHYFGGKRWILRLCEAHAKIYGSGFYQDSGGNHGIVKDRAATDPPEAWKEVTR